MAANGSDDDQTRSFTSLVAGTKISHYTVISKIGAGGMGDVYLAEDTELDRKVALKFLPPHLCQDENCRKRFKREAQAAAKLDHPNIVPVYEVGEFNRRPFFAMAHVQGKSLREVIREGKLTVSEAVELTMQICEGLHKAHESGVVHRDVKPGNIIVDNENRPRILDFGLATVSGEEKLTKTGSTLGTVGYMSPEQVQGGLVDHRSDLFSVGVILYEMITGRTPFDAEHEAAVHYNIVHEDPEPLARYKSGVAGELQQIIDKALSKDISTRYQHADGVVSDLKRLLAPTQSSMGVVPAKQKSKWSFALVGFIVMAALVIAGIEYWPVDDSAQVESLTPERKMLAVLPFENLGAQEDENFADGITDAITSRIAKIGGLGVISRTSAMKYKETDKTLKQIGAELGVSYILEGTIFWDKSGDTDRVRIIPQLIQVSDDSHIWTETYERKMTQIFAVQAGIATSIAEKLNITLLQPERDALTEQPTESTEAYHAYLAGKRHGTDSLAVQMYERAISLDPDFALAYAELSKTHSSFYHSNYDRSEERLQLAKEAVDKALALQPDLPEAHLAFGYYYYHGYREYDKALKEFAIAEKGLPNDPRILQAEAFIWRRLGRFEEAQANFEKAFQLNPRNADAAFQVATNHRWLRNYREALSFYDKAISLRPDHEFYYVGKALSSILMGDLHSARRILSNTPNQENLWIPWVYLEICGRDYGAALEHLTMAKEEMFHAGSSLWSVNLWRGYIYRSMGENELAQIAFDSARTFLESHEEEYSEYVGYHMGLAVTYAGLGRKEEAIRTGQFAVRKHPISRDALLGTRQEYDLAAVYVMTGEYDAAIDLLEHVMSVPYDLESVATLRLKQIWDPLRDHPRFQALMKKYEVLQE